MHDLIFFTYEPPYNRVAFFRSEKNTQAELSKASRQMQEGFSPFFSPVWALPQRAADDCQKGGRGTAGYLGERRRDHIRRCMRR